MKGFATRTALAFSSARANVTDWAAATFAAEELLTTIAGVAWIIAEGDETGAVKRVPRKFGSRASQPSRPARATQIQSVPPGIWAVSRFAR